MKRDRFKKLSIEGDSLNSKLRIIPCLLFLLPFTAVAYIFHQDGFLQRLDSAHLLIFLLILLLALSGNFLLRHVFEKFAMVSDFMKKAGDGEKVVFCNSQCAA